MRCTILSMYTCASCWRPNTRGALLWRPAKRTTAAPCATTVGRCLVQLRSATSAVELVGPLVAAYAAEQAIKTRVVADLPLQRSVDTHTIYLSALLHEVRLRAAQPLLELVHSVEP